MNTIKSIILLAITCIAICSCNNARNVKVNTVINEDGSCTREVIYETTMTQSERDNNWGKGKTGYALPTPQNVDVSKMKHINTELKGDTVMSVFKQEYASVEEMHDKCPFMLDGKPLKSKVEYKKEEGFFYTKYTYTETFTSLKDEFPIPVDKIASMDTIKFWVRGYPDIMLDENGNRLPGFEMSERLTKIEDKVDNWVNDNIIAVYFSTIGKYYDSIPNPPLTKEEFLATRNDFKQYCKNSSKDILDAKEHFHSFYNTDAYDIFMDEESKFCKEINNKLLRMHEILNINIQHNITLPGEVCGGHRINYIANDPKEKGTGHFDISGEELIMGDYKISISTREYHPWAFILTGSVIIIAIGSFIYRRKMKK